VFAKGLTELFYEVSGVDAGAVFYYFEMHVGAGDAAGAAE
jgi:hypothetical protein